LIERFWKHVKGKLRTKSYDDFDIFKATIDSVVDDADKVDKAIIDKLIGEKVKLFDDLVAINENTFASNKTIKNNFTNYIPNVKAAA